jgi:hypothetical protein
LLVFVLGELVRINMALTVVFLLTVVLTVTVTFTIIFVIDTVHGKDGRVTPLVFDPFGKVLEPLSRIHVLQSSAQDFAHKGSSICHRIGDDSVGASGNAPVTFIFR